MMCRVSEPCCPVPKSERLLGTTLDSLVLGPNSTASFKQETAAPTKEMRGYGFGSWDKIHNLVATRVV